MASAPFQGAWQWLHESGDGRLLFTGGHVCAVFGSKDRPPPPDGELDEAEAARLYRTFAYSSAGSWSASEDKGEWLVDMALAVAGHPAQVVYNGGHSLRTARVDGDEMRSEALRPDGTRAPTDRHRRVSAAGTSPLAGAWRLESDERDGIMCMTDSQYRYVVVDRNRPETAGPADDLPDAEAARLYYAFDAEGGSYVVAGATMVRTPELAKDPRVQGREAPIEFELESETLITRTGAKDESVWRKLD